MVEILLLLTIAAFPPFLRSFCGAISTKRSNTGALHFFLGLRMEVVFAMRKQVSRDHAAALQRQIRAPEQGGGCLRPLLCKRRNHSKSIEV